MTKVTKLQKIKTEQDDPQPAESKNAPAVDAPTLISTDQNRNCLFVLGYFLFVYVSMVLAFWMFGQITHQSDRRLGQLHNAQNATEIRDALADEFGTPGWLTTVTTPPKLPTAEEIISESATKIGDTITDTVTDAAKNAITTGAQNGAAAAVENMDAQ